MTRASRCNNFDVLELIESELEVEEVHAVDVQEVGEITVDSGAAKSVWPMRKKGVTRTKTTKTVRLAAANASPIDVEGDARLEFVRDDKLCNMKFLDADVKIPCASLRLVTKATSSFSDSRIRTSRTRTQARGFR